ASEKNIRADKKIKITVAGTLTIGGKVIKESITIGNVTFIFDSSALNYIEGSGPMGPPPGGMDGMAPPPGGMSPPDKMGPPPEN
ncbi:MAG: hypothetical protein PQJ46_06895, partial [Spirochaetales bacterium]|nr:hypothetical protein [Spirochaetales bacterium]